MSATTWTHDALLGLALRVLAVAHALRLGMTSVASLAVESGLVVEVLSRR